MEVAETVNTELAMAFVAESPQSPKSISMEFQLSLVID